MFIFSNSDLIVDISSYSCKELKIVFEEKNAELILRSLIEFNHEFSSHISETFCCIGLLYMEKNLFYAYGENRGVPVHGLCRSCLSVTVANISVFLSLNGMNGGKTC